MCINSKLEYKEFTKGMDLNNIFEKYHTYHSDIVETLKNVPPNAQKYKAGELIIDFIESGKNNLYGVQIAYYSNGINIVNSYIRNKFLDKWSEWISTYNEPRAFYQKFTKMNGQTYDLSTFGYHNGLMIRIDVATSIQIFNPSDLIYTKIYGAAYGIYQYAYADGNPYGLSKVNMDTLTNFFDFGTLPYTMKTSGYLNGFVSHKIYYNADENKTYLAVWLPEFIYQSLNGHYFASSGIGFLFTKY